MKLSTLNPMMKRLEILFLRLDLWVYSNLWGVDTPGYERKVRDLKECRLILRS